MVERAGEQRSTDGLRDFAKYIRENVELAQEHGSDLVDDVAVLYSDNTENPYVTVLVRQNELDDIEIHPDALVDFPDKSELSVLITSTILGGFLNYQSALAETETAPEQS